MDCINISGLYKSFGKTLAVDNFSICVEEGKIFGLLGPNGAGKTTVISIICSLNQKDEGKVEVFGYDINRYSLEIKRLIGVVPQEIAVFNTMTAKENVEFFGALYGLEGRELKEKADNALEFVGLTDTGKKIAKHFSGGMKRRLNIACGIVHEPKLIILDEPTVAIDPQSRSYILNSIKALNKNGTTILYTTHYMEEAEMLCEQITIMDKGKDIACGTSDELKSIIDEKNKVEIMVDLYDSNIGDEILRIKGVEEVKFSKNLLSITMSRHLSVINPVMSKLVERGVSILQVNTTKPSLEDVFLNLTGKKLRD